MDIRDRSRATSSLPAEIRYLMEGEWGTRRGSGSPELSPTERNLKAEDTSRLYSVKVWRENDRAGSFSCFKQRAHAAGSRSRAFITTLKGTPLLNPSQNREASRVLNLENLEANASLMQTGVYLILDYNSPLLSHSSASALQNHYPQALAYGCARMTLKCGRRIHSSFISRDFSFNHDTYPCSILEFTFGFTVYSALGIGIVHNSGSTSVRYSNSDAAFHPDANLDRHTSLSRLFIIFNGRTAVLPAWNTIINRLQRKRRNFYVRLYVLYVRSAMTSIVD
ncbi:hypothetical protein EVAR_17379_1 [Eumeta japonica]|uniref:Uncharacterized protein n=1 Tax=Eumeta variegata TaxID=151549 RepID=A0A4C1WFI7_EUMVA|nr:hypothetical protein EVAR_17379_1 [Eumeta japonica]